MKRTIALTLSGIILAQGSVWCQTIDHRDIVARAKAEEVAAGNNPDNSADGECSRFNIVNRAAAMLAGEGAGVLYKATGNNCRERSVDIIAYPSGRIIDVLGAGAEGPNTPQWFEQTPVDPARWRPAYPVGAGPIVTPPTPPTPDPVPPTPPVLTVDLTPVLTRLDALQAELKRHEEVEEGHWNNAKNAFYQALKVLTPIIGGLVAGRTLLK